MSEIMFKELPDEEILNAVNEGLGFEWGENPSEDLTKGDRALARKAEAYRTEQIAEELGQVMDNAPIGFRFREVEKFRQVLKKLAEEANK